MTIVCSWWIRQTMSDSSQNSSLVCLHWHWLVYCQQCFCGFVCISLLHEMEYCICSRVANQGIGYQLLCGKYPALCSHSYIGMSVLLHVSPSFCVHDFRLSELNTFTAFRSNSTNLGHQCIIVTDAHILQPHSGI
jgi:hypothetical protein